MYVCMYLHMHMYLCKSTFRATIKWESGKTTCNA